MIKHYIVVEHGVELEPGEHVYSLDTPHYDSVPADTEQTGIEHISITRKPTGKPPAISVPRYFLKEITLEVLSMVVAAAHNQTIVYNALIGNYNPYCMRCEGFVRMKRTGLLRWQHDCGAQHDEAEARSALLDIR